MVSMRVDEIEEAGLALVPGTVLDRRCTRCGEKIALSPAMLRAFNGGLPEVWCWPCLWEVHPEGVNFRRAR